MSEVRRMQACCYDCGRQHGDEFGFPDLIVPHDVWAKIAPDDGNGLLCPSCMLRRMALLGLTNVRSTFASGPCSLMEYDDYSKLAREMNSTGVKPTYHYQAISNGSGAVTSAGKSFGT